MGLLSLFRAVKRIHSDEISAAITGVKPGDRVIIAGPDDVTLAVELATRSGLNGRLVSLAANPAAAESRAAKIEQGGGLAEPLAAPLNMLPLDSGTFDVAVAEHTLLALSDQDRRGAIGELFRVLRPGGRLLWIERQPRGGLFKLAPDSRGIPVPSEFERMLTQSGFRGVRVLAEAEGRIYLEGIKASQ
jgi:SAM-dependent methyltransferase